MFLDGDQDGWYLGVISWREVMLQTKLKHVYTSINSFAEFTIALAASMIKGTAPDYSSTGVFFL